MRDMIYALEKELESKHKELGLVSREAAKLRKKESQWEIMQVQQGPEPENYARPKHLVTADIPIMLSTLFQIPQGLVMHPVRERFSDMLAKWLIRALCAAVFIPLVLLAVLVGFIILSPGPDWTAERDRHYAEWREENREAFEAFKKLAAERGWKMYAMARRRDGGQSCRGSYGFSLRGSGKSALTPAPRCGRLTLHWGGVRPQTGPVPIFLSIARSAGSRAEPQKERSL